MNRTGSKHDDWWRWQLRRLHQSFYQLVEPYELLVRDQRVILAYYLAVRELEAPRAPDDDLLLRLFATAENYLLEIAAAMIRKEAFAAEEHQALRKHFWRIHKITFYHLSPSIPMRKKERKKPGLKRARRAPQWSKR